MSRLFSRPWFFALVVGCFPLATAVTNLATRKEPFEWGVEACWAVAGLLALPVVMLLAHKARYARAVSVPHLWALLVVSVALNLGANLFAFAAPWQLPLAVFMTMGVACVLSGLLRRWAFLPWWVFLFFEFTQVLGYHEYGSHINSLGIAETLESSQEEFFSYFTLGNGAIISSFVLLAAPAAWLIGRCLRGEKHPALLNTGLLFISLSLLGGACLPPQHRTPEYYWPATEAYRLGDALAEALTVNQATIAQAESLPSPAEQPSRITTLKGGEGAVLVLHIGESVRADRTSLNGYERDTTPWLRQQPRLINFSDCISSACDTCQAELVLMTDGRRNINSRDPATQPTTGSVLDLFAANGFEVYSFFGRRCAQQLKYDRVVRLLTRVSKQRFNAPGSPWTAVPQMQGVLAEHPQQNLVFFVNNEGSHTPFEHFDTQQPPFTPAEGSFEQPAAHAEEVNNAYDNTICYTDEFIRRAATSLAGRPWVYVYVSDHGEYLGHDGIWGRAGLGESHINYHNTTGSRVAAFVLWSPEFEQLHPRIAASLAQLQAHRDLCIGHEHLFSTLLGLFGIETPHYRPELDLTNPEVKPYGGPKPAK